MSAYELNTRSTSASQSGAASSGTAGDWNINFGSGTLSASPVPQWFWIVAAVGAVVYLVRRGKG